jgi:hypothetical protein
VRHDVSRADHFSDGLLGQPWPANPLRRTSLFLAAMSLRGASLASGGLERVGDLLGLALCNRAATDEALASWVNQSDWPARPLRVAITTRGAWARRLPDSRGAFNVEWSQVGTMLRTEDLLGSYGFDAVVGASADGSPVVELRETEGRDAAWYDWALRRPISYATLFPARLDCARISLEHEPRTMAQTDVLRAMIEAACVLARCEARTDLNDRLRGRMPATGSGAGSYGPGRAAWVALCGLAESLVDALRQPSGEPSSVLVAASRVVGAWAAMADDRLADERRAAYAEAAIHATSCEAEAWLRLGAVRFATLSDAAGHDALSKAFALLGATSDVPVLKEQQVFVSAELSGDDGHLTTTGRTAAGICLLLANTNAEKRRFVADDLRDEMRFSGLLVGRDQDHRLLLDVLGRLVPESVVCPPALSKTVESAAPDQDTPTPTMDRADQPLNDKPRRSRAKPRAAKPVTKRAAKPRRKAA